MQYKLDINFYSDKLIHHFDEEKWLSVSEHLDTLQFKYNKSYYHLSNIHQKAEEAIDFSQFDYYERICNPLYYETESFLIALRSTVDIVLHLLNEVFDCGINSGEVHLGTIYKNLNINKIIRNIFHRYTHNRDGTTWSFIYQHRNEFVHAKSIEQTLPLTIDFFQSPHPIVFFELNGEQRNIITFLDNCLNFIKRFIMHLLEAIVVSLDDSFKK